mmetsp:Transcript_18504/g.53104  ORF Transcript_18504/g.53104 Transcript_18504/m.53104 type:complete len:214 (-) Transcript_18504:175-816(-)
MFIVTTHNPRGNMSHIDGSRAGGAISTKACPEPLTDSLGRFINKVIFSMVANIIYKQRIRNVRCRINRKLCAIEICTTPVNCLIQAVRAGDINDAHLWYAIHAKTNGYAKEGIIVHKVGRSVNWIYAPGIAIWNPISLRTAGILRLVLFSNDEIGGELGTYVLRNDPLHFLIDLCDQIHPALDLGLSTVARIADHISGLESNLSCCRVLSRVF